MEKGGWGAWILPDRRGWGFRDTSLLSVDGAFYSFGPTSDHKNGATETRMPTRVAQLRVTSS